MQTMKAAAADAAAAFLYKKRVRCHWQRTLVLVKTYFRLKKASLPRY